VSRERIISSNHGVALSEREFSDGGTVVARAFSVTSRRTPIVTSFSVLSEAEAYGDAEIAKVLTLS
jgi:hypothetical protein